MIQVKRMSKSIIIRICLFVFFLHYSLISQAIPVLENDNHRLNIDGAFKSFFIALSYQHFDTTTRQLIGLNNTSSAAIGIFDARLKIEGEHFNRLKWKIHYRVQPFFSTFSGAQSALAFSSFARPARFLPLQFRHLNADEQIILNHEIDRFLISYRISDKIEIIAGRQPISLGVGFVWMPADLVGTFSPLELDREFKTGVDALRINLALGDFTELSLIGALGGPACINDFYPNGQSCRQSDIKLSADHSLALSRFRTTIGDIDLGFLAGYIRGDIVGGSFITTAIKRFRLRSEVTLTYDIEEDQSDNTGRIYAGIGSNAEQSDFFIRAIVGADYSFDTKHPWAILIELYYNGFGSTNTNDYLRIAQSPRISEHGEIYNVGKVYLASGINGEFHEKLPLSLIVMANIIDPSFQLALSATYKVSDESDFVFGAQIPIGKTPIVNTTTIDMRSEFGFYPLTLYGIWRVYF